MKLNFQLFLEINFNFETIYFLIFTYNSAQLLNILVPRECQFFNSYVSVNNLIFIEKKLGRDSSGRNSFVFQILSFHVLQDVIFPPLLKPFYYFLVAVSCWPFLPRTI